jgi:Fe-S oxidoreductase
MPPINTAFAPGCALMLYKPELAQKTHEFLNENYGKMDLHLTCCHHEPPFSEKTNIINICPGCNKRFRNDYEQTTTISLWEVLADNEDFPFPDYHGKNMTILDACPTRNDARVQESIRTLLKKMNINLIEPKKTRTKGTCCGDSFYGTIPVSKVKEQMKKRSDEMPLDDVVVYCVSCTKSIFIGGKQPHYLIDLLFNQETEQKTLDPDEWHKELDDFIDEH